MSDKTHLGLYLPSMAIFAPGSIYAEGKAAVELLQEKYGITVSGDRSTVSGEGK